MSDINKQDASAKAVPFFARYLEEQEVSQELSQEELEGLSGARTTLKYPSDSDEGDISGSWRN
uniref:Microviridin/marinostatin family tricyclic proteinase inhibitor n=1 Tax=Cyanothece sp. (strain PCC 7425 / ATCC 29141) TaxID=395961 RepID=B8HSS0_CYAP4